MIFQNPIMLFALLAISVPIAIHLWSRQKPKLIRMGSIKYVESSDIKKARNIKLTQIPLLLLRVLILIILVMLLSEISFLSSGTSTKSAVIYEESMVEDEQLRNQISNAQSKVSKSYTFENFGANNQDYYRIIRSLDMQGFDSIYIFTHGYYRNYQGQRPNVNSAIQWTLVPVNEQKILESPISYKLGDARFLKINSISTQSGIEYNRESLETYNSETELDLSQLKVAIYRNSEVYNENSILLVSSGLKAIEKWLNLEIQINNLDNLGSSAEYDILIYLDKISELKNKEFSTKKVITFTRNSIMQETGERVINDNLVYLIPQSLIEYPEIYAGYGLTDRLLRIVTDADFDTPDIRTFERVESIALKRNVKTGKTEQASFETIPTILLILLLICLIGERVYSNFYIKIKNGAKG